MIGAQRIMVLGSPGSGKTTFARRLKAVTGLPLTHLDDLYWEGSWVRTASQLFTKRVEQVVQGHRWIIDGNHADSVSIRLQHADLVYFIEVQPLVCLYRVVARGIRRYAGEDESLPMAIAQDGNYRPLLSMDYSFARKVLMFRRQTREARKNKPVFLIWPLVSEYRTGLEAEAEASG